MTDKERYEALVNSKTYGEMDDKEQLFCMEYETDLLLPDIESLRADGVEDYKISAYLQDLYDEYLVCDDVCIANVAEISDDDYERGREYGWYEMEEKNPLIKD